MKITADTNLLVRAATLDHPQQAPVAVKALAEAEAVALPLPALCELAWVLSSGYRIGAADIALAIRRLLDAANVIVDWPAAEAGLAQLESGGDFADGVIAFEGRSLGADLFVSFDVQAVKLIQSRGQAAQLLV